MVRIIKDVDKYVSWYSADKNIFSQVKRYQPKIHPVAD